MRTTPSRFSLVCLLLLIVLSGAAHGIFFQGPKRAIWNLLESLGGHKKPPPPPVHHYHMHYYPVPVPAPKPHPHKIEIDLSSLHSSHDPLRSYGWPPSHQEPEFVLPPSDSSSGAWASALQPEVWPESAFQQKSSWQWDNNELLEKDPAHTDAKSGILLQVPLHQQIVLYQPPAKDKSSLLKTLLKKIRRINDAIFHPEDEEHSHDPHDDKPHIHNTLTYATSAAR